MKDSNSMTIDRPKRKRYTTDEERKAARKESQRKWDEKNRDRIREYQRRYYHEHKAQLNARSAKRIKQTREKLPERKRHPNFTNEEERIAYRREYMRKYREANRAKTSEYSRESNRRRRAGEEKRKSGPPKGTEFIKQDFVMPKPSASPLVKKPVKEARLCEKCLNWPCFEGIENLETDFARIGCHSFHTEK